MAAYMAGLRVLLARDDRVYLCGHGPVLPEPQALVRAMLGHRMGRESAVLGALGDAPVTSMAIVEQLYAGLDARLKKAADRTVMAHLQKLADEGRAIAVADGYVKA
jgi:glyoxylase-like metal-dependent hydrolase (beta-lactamase superfamily II)